MRSTTKTRTALATAVSSLALIGGSLLAAAPAQAATHTVWGKTYSSCTTQLRAAIQDLRAGGQYVSSTSCRKYQADIYGGYVYQAYITYR